MFAMVDQNEQVMAMDDGLKRKRRPARTADVAARAGENAKAFAIEAARTISDLHCTEVILLDTQGMSQVTDFIIIATGTSDRQICSVGDDVAKLARTHGFSRYGSEQDPRATWLVVDFVDVVVHLFEPATRAHYDLEMMWGDVPRIEWQRTRGERKAI